MSTAVEDWGDVDSMAHEAAGNWKKFDSFAWYEKPEDAEKWCVVYTKNRDSDCLEESNAAAIDEMMAKYKKDVRSEAVNSIGVGAVAFPVDSERDKE